MPYRPFRLKSLLRVASLAPLLFAPCSHAALEAAEGEIVLTCKVFDTAETPPKQILQSVFTIDMAKQLSRQAFEDLDGAAEDGTEWYDAKVDGDVIGWEDEAADFELNVSTGKCSYLGMDGVRDYECEKLAP